MKRLTIISICLAGIPLATSPAAADHVCGTGTLLDVQSSTRIRPGQEVTTSSVRRRDHGREKVYQSVTSPSEQKITEYTIAARLDGIVYTAQSRDFFWRTKPTAFIIGDPIQVCVNKAKILLAGLDGKQYKATVVRATRQEITSSPSPEGAPQEQPESETGAPPANASPDELDRIVSRIALYPDPLLAQVLTAATHPDEIPAASEWADLHSSIKGDTPAHLVKQDNLTWDSSVQALLAFPSVLSMMSRDPSWTLQLGNATLAQRAEVMDAVQRMRQKAKEFGYLQNNEQISVTSPAPNIVEIEPANPLVISVPVYDPGVVFARRPFDERVGIWAGPTVATGPTVSVWDLSGSGFIWSSHRVRIGHRDWDDDWMRRRRDHGREFHHDGSTNFPPPKEPDRPPRRREMHGARLSDGPNH